MTSSLYQVWFRNENCCAPKSRYNEYFQVVKGQLDRDARLVGLVKTMEDVYSFVDATESFRNKVKVLEKTISKILKQTVECAIFIREYTGHGFGGELLKT